MLFHPKAHGVSSRGGKYDWHDDAACATADPDLFFPTSGVAVLEAKLYCAVCPVIARCLDKALNSPDTYGVWGGTTDRERIAMRRPDPRIYCGTVDGYETHLGSGEVPCSDCRHAAAVARAS